MLADGVVLVGANLVLRSVFEVGNSDVVARGGQQYPARLRQRPYPFEQRLALSGEGGGKQAVVGLVQGQAIEAIPGKAQGQGVIDAGTLEHRTNDLGTDTVDTVITGKVLIIHRHIEGREILGQQYHFVIGWQLCTGSTGAQEKPKQ